MDACDYLVRWKRSAVSSNLSFFGDSEGNCTTCSLNKDVCVCYGVPNPDHVMLPTNSPLIAELLAECRGLHFDNVVASPLLLPDLRSVPFIPIVTGGGKKLFSEKFILPYVGVTLNDALNNAKTHAKPDIRTACGVPADTKIILLAHGNDVVLGKFSKHQRTIFKELALQDIYLNVAPNNSVWEGHPEIERLINMKLPLVSYDLMSKAGLCTVPHFLWRGDRSEDLEVIARWLNRYPAVSMVAINLQTYQSQEDWQRVTAELQMLHSLIDHQIHFLIIGPSTDIRILDISHILGSSFTIMSALPAILAWSRADIVNSNRGVRRRVYTRKPELQTGLFETGYPPTDPLVVAELFATSNISLGTHIKNLREPEIVGHIKQAMSVRSFKSRKVAARKMPRSPKAVVSHAKVSA